MPTWTGRWPAGWSGWPATSRVWAIGRPSSDQYPTAMTALAGTALLCEGSTTMQGKYAPNIRKAVDYLVGRSRPNGLIGDPTRDDRYTYGHGFAMLFLSQVLGEEEDAERREQLIDVLTRAVVFTGRAQTTGGGWGYVSAKDGNNFDEGSTTITQVQGLRGCRNAGIPVPKEIVDKAVKYIKKCTGPDGGVRYNLAGGGGGGRPPITAAAVACLFNAGDYDSQYVPKLLNYCQRNLGDISNQGFGHWHYAHYYYAQVLYREGGKKWEAYRDKIFPRLVSRGRQRRIVEPRLHRPGLHHGRQLDHPATAQRRAADLPTISTCSRQCACVKSHRQHANSGAIHATHDYQRGHTP